MRFRVRYDKLGAHWHCRFFVLSAGATWAGCGTLVLREGEFEALRALLEPAILFEPKESPPA